MYTVCSLFDVHIYLLFLVQCLCFFFVLCIFGVRQIRCFSIEIALLDFLEKFLLLCLATLLKIEFVHLAHLQINKENIELFSPCDV